MVESYMLLLLYIFFSAVLITFGIHRLLLVVAYLIVKHSPLKSDKDNELLRKKSKDFYPFVTIQLPIYNEKNVAERLLKSCSVIDWPKDRLEIQVLDDSSDSSQKELEALCMSMKKENIDISYIHRRERVGYKAGALQEGLEIAKGDFCLILDADFIPPKDFLSECMYPFQDNGIVMVQTRWGHLNQKENWLTRAQALLLDSHFSIGHYVRFHLGHFFNFNGTAGIWRTSAIVKAGGWKASTLTEDLDLSLRSFLKGGRFYYIDDFVVPAELPSDVSAFKGQQYRWSKGAIQVLKLYLPSILSAKLTFIQKADLIIKLMQNFSFLALFFMILLLPIVAHQHFLRHHLWAFYTDFSLFFGASLPIFLDFYLSGKHCGYSRIQSFWRIPMALTVGIALSVNNSQAVLNGLLGSGSNVFVRTPKQGLIKSKTEHSVHFLKLEFLVGSLQIFAAVYMVFMNTYWAIPFLLLFGFSLISFALPSFMFRFYRDDNAG